MNNLKVKSKITVTKGTGGTFGTTTANTGLSQRQTLEAIMINLAGVLNIKEIFKIFSARGSTFYSFDSGHNKIYQSATNTILELSKKIQDSVISNSQR